MSGEEWEVEKICGHRVNKDGDFEFLIKWKGYDLEQWVNEANVNCPNFMEEYRAEHHEAMEKDKQNYELQKARAHQSESKEGQKEEEEDQNEPEEKNVKKEKVKKEKQSKKEKEEKPKKEKKKAEKEKPDKEKVKVISYFKYKNKRYYKIEDKNGEVSDIPANQARAKYPTKIIEYLESKLPKE